MGLLDKVKDVATDLVKATVRYPKAIITGKKPENAEEVFATKYFQFLGKNQDKAVPVVLSLFGAKAKKDATLDAKNFVNTNKPKGMNLLDIFGGGNKVTTEGVSTTSPKTGGLQTVADAFNGMLGGSGADYTNVIKNSGVSGNIQFGTSKSTTNTSGPAAGIVMGIVLPALLVVAVIWGVVKLVKYIARGGRK